ncbi:hypothetical protein GGD89_000669 [Roseospira visakhapatnamensis]|uniref:Uncharacterized protein n=1 Tax=Roseospira visakhapatnamensis TaxID=390880 RepID=A0A7W6RAQ2_9PROT|nr:hypothetical protein [Roseospira visakhapatnamensis]
MPHALLVIVAAATAGVSMGLGSSPVVRIRAVMINRDAVPLLRDPRVGSVPFASAIPGRMTA